MVYTAEKNRGLTLRLHFMLMVAWAVGAFKSLSQCFYGEHQDKSKWPQFGFLIVIQFMNFAYQASSMRILKSVARQDQLKQEKVKVWLHILLTVAVMVCVILSDPSLPHSPVPLSTMVVTSFLAVLDMLRMAALLQLQAIKWMCFAFLEADHYLRAPRMTKAQVGADVLYALIFGTIVPLGIAAVSEAYQREDFLRDCRKPMSALEPTWSAWLRVLRRLPGMRADRTEDLASRGARGETSVGQPERDRPHAD